jgi:CheY-like chemotaxis protein
MTNLAGHSEHAAAVALRLDGMITKPVRSTHLAAVLEGRNTPMDVAAVHLATRRPPIAEATEIPAADDEGDGPRILLAEDNAFNQKVAVSMLSMLGCRVEVACNGAEALDMIQRKEYDLVCMDCQMPEMDGYEATRRIRALPGRVSRVPIVAMTANALSGDRQACLDAGMDDFLCKPISKSMLGEMLEKFGLVMTPA